MADKQVPEISALMERGDATQHFLQSRMEEVVLSSPSPDFAPLSSNAVCGPFLTTPETIHVLDALRIVTAPNGEDSKPVWKFKAE